MRAAREKAFYTEALTVSLMRRQCGATFSPPRILKNEVVGCFFRPLCIEAVELRVPAGKE